MWISDTSIKRPVFATMVIASFMVLGIVSMTRLGIDLFPEVNFPFVNVSVVYPGAAPEEVETLVTKPVEDAIAGINGVKRVISTSTEGFSRVGIEMFTNGKLTSGKRSMPSLVIDTMPSTMKLTMTIVAKTGRLIEVSEIHIGPSSTSPEPREPWCQPAGPAGHPQ